MPRQVFLGLCGAGLALSLLAQPAAGQALQDGIGHSSTPYAAPSPVRMREENPPVVQDPPTVLEAGPEHLTPVPGDVVVEGPAPEPPSPPVNPKHTLEHKGNPERVAWYAVPTDTGSYIGYYVGGGAPCRGEARLGNEGTWGWDYQGWLFPRRVALGWWHGRRSQGGIGRYRTVFQPSVQSPSTP